MKVPKNKLVLAAAFTGLVSGTVARVEAQTTDSRAGQPVADAKKDTKKIAKHSCKGKNACKGQGGCGSGDNGCAGKNSCKGKGGCATDGKMK
jgi:hypothetical protein